MLRKIAMRCAAVVALGLLMTAPCPNIPTLTAAPAEAAQKTPKAKKVPKAQKEQKPQKDNATVMQGLFWRRAWAEMDRAYASGTPTVQDHALMANACRLRNKWADAVSILEAHGKSFPASVRPYADMTLVLGYEQLGRKKDALALAERLWKDAPQDLRYYVALAQHRLLKDSGDTKRIETALNRMLQNAGTNDRKIHALSRLVALPGNRAEQALKLLDLQPSNKRGAEVLARQKSPTAAMNVALGVYAHLVGDNKGAVERLKSVPLGAAGGRKAAYHRAWSLSRLKQNNDALTLWGSLALNGNGYAESSVRRIANLAKDKGMREPCLAALERIARERRGGVQARALLSLGGLLGKDQQKRKDAIDAQILQSFPNTKYAFNVLWRRGWTSINAGNAAEAARLWKQADAPGVNAYTRARILYWLSQAQRAAGQTGEADRTLALLKRKYPLTIYGLLTKQPLKIIDGENPALSLGPSELEQWGFVQYARLRLARPKATAKELYRALKLSRWLGLEESYSEARRLETLMSSSTTLYRSDLEALYPRAFRAQVEAAAKEYDVEAPFIWAIMRQESAFRPDARSHAGAAGLMQLMPGTAKGEAQRMGLKKYDILDVSDNIRMGTSHLAWLARSFARKEWIMAAYNAGSGNARKWMKNGGDRLALDRWIEAVRFDETCGYVQRVSANLEIYRMLYGAQGAGKK